MPSPCWCRVPSAPVGLQVLGGTPWMGVLGLVLAPNKVLVKLGWAQHCWGVMGSGAEGVLGL